MDKLKSILKSFKSITWIFACVLAFSSCKSTYVEKFTVNDFPAFRNQCIGQTYNQIVTNLGAPQRQTPDGNGGTILIYENTTTTSISNSLAKAYNVNYFSKTYTPGVETTTQVINKTDYVQYFVNSNNVCYDVKTNIPMSHVEKGNSYRKVSFLKTFLLVCGCITGAMCGTVLLLPVIFP